MDGPTLSVTHLLPPDLSGVYLGWLIVEPRRHVTSLSALTEAEAVELGTTLKRIDAALRSALDAEHVYVKLMGDAVPHLHLHVVPRYPGTPQEFWGDALTDWPQAPRGGQAEIAEICDRLAAAIPS